MAISPDGLRHGDCDACPLNARPLVQGYGPKDADLMIVGEAPDGNAARRGRPFVGDSGNVLRQSLKAVGIDPEEVYYTHAVMRHPLANKTPNLTPIRKCNDRLFEEIAEVNPSKILAVGGVALTALLKAPRVLPITKLRGQAQWVEWGALRALMIPTVHPALILRDPNYFPDFISDIEKWSRVETPLVLPQIDTWILNSRIEVEQALEMIEDASIVSCDLETTGFNPITNEILSVGFGVIDTEDAGLSIVVPRRLLHNEKVREMLWQFMWDPIRRMVFHNAKFDLQFLLRYFDSRLPDDVVPADTMLLHYLTDERPIGRYLGHGLKDIARVRYDVPDYHFDFEGFYATPEEERDYTSLFTYQGQDTYFTARLYGELLEEVEEDKPELQRVHDEILAPGAVALAEAELHGTHVDLDFFKALGNKLERRLERRLRILRAVTKDTHEEFNPQSPVQVQKLAYEVFGFLGKGTGVDREQLEAMIRQAGPRDRRSKILKHIIGYRNDQKVLQTYVTGLLDKVDGDGRIRPDFQLAGTATGRLSCRNPNFQNIPAYGAWKVREGFDVPPGHVFVEADYSQLELRVAAWLSEDPDLIDVFATGKDIHSEVAVAMFNKPADQITDGERYMAKRVDFGIMYGRSAKALAEGPEMDYLVDELGGTRWSVEEAEMYVTRFLEGFPKLRQWMQDTANATIEDQYVDTPLGRRRRFPFITRGLVGHTRRQAVNTPIQSVASDLTLTALVRLSKALPDDCHILFTVHDSIAIEVPEARLEEAAKIIRYEMEENLPIDRRGIPFPCDIEVGPNWGTLTKMKVER